MWANGAHAVTFREYYIYKEAFCSRRLVRCNWYTARAKKNSADVGTNNVGSALQRTPVLPTSALVLDFAPLLFSPGSLAAFDRLSNTPAPDRFTRRSLITATLLPSSETRGEACGERIPAS